MSWISRYINVESIDVSPADHLKIFVLLYIFVTKINNINYTSIYGIRIL